MKKNIKHTPFGYDKNTEICIADEQGVLYRRDGRVLISCPNKDLTRYAIKEGTIVIDKKAFASCDCLEEIIIPDSVTTISGRAFDGCKSLTKIFIPASVYAIEFSAFDDCSKLEKFEVAQDNPTYCSVDGVAYSKNMFILYKCPPSAPFTSYDIPDSVRIIGPSAFEGCTSLRQVTIGKGVAYMQSGVFQECKSLSLVHYNATSCLSAGGMFPIFRGCDSLRKVVIGNNVVELPDDLFILCEELSEVNIPESITTIGNGVFRLCSKLSHLYIPHSVSTIGIHAFSTDGPVNIEMAEDNPYYCVIGNALYSKDMTQLYQVAGGDNSLESFVIPDGVTHIGDYAFEWCDFLHSVTIPDSVIYIGKNAFSAAFGPESIILPPHLEYLGDFSLCAYDLRTITSLNPTPPSCGQLFTYDYSDAQGFSHSYMHKNCVLRVPKGCKEAYASADEWCEFENIEEID